LDGPSTECDSERLRGVAEQRDHRAALLTPARCEPAGRGADCVDPLAHAPTPGATHRIVLGQVRRIRVGAGVQELPEVRPREREVINISPGIHIRLLRPVPPSLERAASVAAAPPVSSVDGISLRATSTRYSTWSANTPLGSRIWPEDTYGRPAGVHSLPLLVPPGAVEMASSLKEEDRTHAYQDQEIDRDHPQQHRGADVGRVRKRRRRR